MSSRSLLPTSASDAAAMAPLLQAAPPQPTAPAAVPTPLAKSRASTESRVVFAYGMRLPLLIVTTLASAALIGAALYLWLARSGTEASNASASAPEGTVGIGFNVARALRRAMAGDSASDSAEATPALPQCVVYQPMPCPGPHRCSPKPGEDESSAHCDACQCCPNGNACANSPDSCLDKCPTKKRDYEAPLCPGMANWTINQSEPPPVPSEAIAPTDNSEPSASAGDGNGSGNGNANSNGETNGHATSTESANGGGGDCPPALGPCDVPFSEADRAYGALIGKPTDEWKCGCGINGCEQMTPKFNWVIGSCRRGVGQACAWMPDGTGAQSEVVLNYMATYQYRLPVTYDSGPNAQSGPWERDWSDGEFVLVPDSSKNTNGECGNATDLVRDHTSWLQAQPGSSGGWEQGYYPAHVPGVGPPAMLYVMSTEVFRYATLYLLNQATLNRGPAVLNPLCFSPGSTALNNSNCWGDGSAGEIDLLEPPFWDEVAKNRTEVYDRLYATSFNSAGRCFPVQNLPTGGSGGQQTNAYFLGDRKPHVWAAVIDRAGTTIYRDPERWLTPTGEVGLNRTRAARVLRARPEVAPQCNRPPCDACAADMTCALYMPSCPSEHGGHCRPELATEERTQSRECALNWWDLFADTRQHTVQRSVQWLHDKHHSEPPPCTCAADTADATAAPTAAITSESDANSDVRNGNGNRNDNGHGNGHGNGGSGGGSGDGDESSSVPTAVV